MEKHTPQSLAGRGLHTGAPARLEFALRTVQAHAGSLPPIGAVEPAGLAEHAASKGAGGPRFRCSGTPWISGPEWAALPRRADRSTRLGITGSEVRTPEHLLAALLFFPDSPLDIECDAAELPGLDGSALPFREALSRLDPASAASPAWRLRPCNLEWEYHWSYGSIRVRPAAAFRAAYELDRSPLRQSFVLEDAATAWREVLPARTFAFHREWREASANGLMAGADLDSGLLLAESEAEHRDLLRGNPEWTGGPFPLLNRPAWRMENELAKHKVLDLLGDLALAGLALPRLDIRIRNGGHHINHMLVDRLIGS